MIPNLDLVGCKISYAKLHGGDTFVPGFGSFGNTLPSSSKSVRLDMTHVAAGIFINFHDVTKNLKAEATVPWANVQIAVYVTEPAPLSVVKQASN